MFTNTAADTSPRLQPKSAMIGLTITPIMRRAPAFRNRMTNEAASTHQPKEMVGLALLMDPGTDRSWLAPADDGSIRLPPGSCSAAAHVRGPRGLHSSTACSAPRRERFGEGGPGAARAREPRGHWRGDAMAHLLNDFHVRSSRRVRRTRQGSPQLARVLGRDGSVNESVR